MLDQLYDYKILDTRRYEELNQTEGLKRDAAQGEERAETRTPRACGRDERAAEAPKVAVK